MTLRTRFILFAVLIHAVMALIAARLLTTDKIWFVATEALIIVSIIVTVNIYRSFVRPLDIVSAGIESIRSKDFTVKFRSEEHTSELQSRQYLVCRLLLEKKKNSIYSSS